MLRGFMERWRKITTLLERVSAKNWFTLLIVVILFVDLIIFLDIPFLRQIFAFLCFTTIPGFLIIQILKLTKIEFLKKIVLSVGLSIAFLLFFGLFINQLYLAIGLFKPLSTNSLAISFTVILTILSFIAYKRNKDDFNLSDILNVKFDIKKDQLISPYIFPIIFPFLAIFGTYLMNATANNMILVVMLFLIPIYVVLIVWLRNKIPKTTYPVAIYTIALALLLMHGLTSNYVNGRDVHMEYYAFRVVAINGYWSMSNFHHVLTACLSTSLLPTIYWSLLSINKLYIYKVIYQMIWAVTPLVCYIIFKKYVGELHAFLASLFFIFQMSFIFGLQSAMRTELAIFFVALAMMVFFDDKIDKPSKKLFFLIFIFSVIISHYSTAYVFFIIFVLFWLVTGLLKNFSKFKFKYPITGTVLFLFFSVIFMWYSQITDIAFTQGVRFVRETFLNLQNLFVEELRYKSLYSSLSGKSATELPRKISISTYWTSFTFIAIGVFDSIRAYKNNKKHFEIEYLSMALISGGILVAFIILPYVSIGYGANRTYQLMLVTLAIAFVIGGEAICKYIRHPQFSLLIITMVLISQFFCGSFFIHSLLGSPSEDLNREGDMYGEYYIHDQEVIGAKWLNVHNANNSKIHTDQGGESRLLMGSEVSKMPDIDSKFFTENKTMNKGYIFLRNENIVNKTVRLSGYFEDTAPLSNYTHLFIGECKIYSNGFVEVY
jgi:uncharacterized membrane protein